MATFCTLPGSKSQAREEGCFDAGQTQTQRGSRGVFKRALKKLPIAAIGLASLSLTIAKAAPPEGPRLLGGRDVPECTTALQYAQAAYLSKVRRLGDYEEPPASGDHMRAPLGDPTVFTRVESSSFDVIDKVKWPDSEGVDPERHSYWFLWETNPKIRTRLVLVGAMNHGDVAFGVVSIPSSWTPAKYDQVIQNGTPGDGITEFVPASYLPHLIFLRKDTGHLWLIYPGDKSDFLPNWRIYVAISDRYQEACQIQFRPPVDHASLLLPDAVQQLDRLILRSIGMPAWGNGQTPVGRESIEGNIELANAALRPWAMGNPWHSRKKLEAGLLAWSRRGANYQKDYVALWAQYAVAEKALAEYYLQKFKMNPEQAQNMAKVAADVVFRTYYTF